MKVNGWEMDPRLLDAISSSSVSVGIGAYDKGIYESICMLLISIHNPLKLPENIPANKVERSNADPIVCPTATVGDEVFRYRSVDWDGVRVASREVQLRTAWEVLRRDAGLRKVRVTLQGQGMEGESGAREYCWRACSVFNCQVTSSRKVLRSTVKSERLSSETKGAEKERSKESLSLLRVAEKYEGTLGMQSKSSPCS